MSAHTPGPWAIEHARTLLRTNKECDYGRKPILDPIVEANARLIAAAPDLLAALKAMVAATDHWAEESSSHFTQPKGLRPRDLARAAISKATGDA